MGTLHFSIGSDFGNLCGQIAQEHLLYNYDIEKAMRVFREGMGMPDDYIFKCLSGEDFVLRVNEEDQSVYITEREESDTYPKLEAEKTAKHWADQVAEEGEELIFTIGKLYRTLGNSVCLNMEVNFQDLINIFYVNDYSEGKSDIFNKMIEQLDEMDMNDSSEGDCIRKVKFVKFFNNWKISVKKKMDIIKFILDNNLTKNTESVQHSYNVIANQLIETVQFFEAEYSENLIREPETERLSKTEESIANRLFDYENTHREYAWEVTSDMQADAIWVSPEGKAYGSNGAIHDMLHLTIADWLQEKGIIHYDREESGCCTIDSYLEHEGWCKIHGDWVLMDPFAKSMNFEMPTNRMTDEQVDFIADYFKNRRTFMKCGYEHKPISYITFKNLDTIMRTQLFAY